MTDRNQKQDRKELDYILNFFRQSNQLLDNQIVTQEGTLMFPAYQAALGALKTVLDCSDEWDSLNREKHDDKKNYYGYGNNVIAFCAPRGQGKTSAMLSLTNALKHSSAHYHQEYCREDENLLDEIMRDRRFFVLPPIDPTVLDKSENIIGLVLAKLLQEINERWAKQSGETRAYMESQKMEALKHFQSCRECLASHSGTKENDLSDLIKASNILEIKKHLYQIITYYFGLFNIENKRCYLVIQLDDTDMDMDNAYRVLEDVRKFLSLPKTVVFMATYLRQLRRLVAKHYEEAMPPIKEKADDGRLIDYMQLAAKYIDKLIPAQQMIHINSFHYQRDLNGVVKVRDIVLCNSEKDEEKAELAELLDKDLEEVFFELIRKKTGLLFLKHRTYVHSILPTTLRGLNHFYQLLSGMKLPEAEFNNIYLPDDPEPRDSWLVIKTYERYRDSLRIRQRNLILFEDYFRNDWCYSNLEESEQEILWKISQAHMAPKLRIIRNLLAKRWKWVSEWAKKSDNVDVSFFDVTCLLREGEKQASDMRDLHLVFAIRTHLSIQLHKLYIADILEDLEKREDGFSVEKHEQAEQGVFTASSFRQLKLFMKSDKECHELEQFDDIESTSDCIKKSDCNQMIGDTVGSCHHMALMYKLFLDACVPEKGDPKKNALLYELQNSAFRALGNHDVLRLYLSCQMPSFGDPEWREQFEKYIEKDNNYNGQRDILKKMFSVSEKLRTDQGAKQSKEKYGDRDNGNRMNILEPRPILDIADNLYNVDGGETKPGDLPGLPSPDQLEFFTQEDETQES